MAREKQEGLQAPMKRRRESLSIDEPEISTTESARRYTGYQREQPVMGPRVDKLTALYELPCEGDLIILRQVVPYVSVKVRHEDSPAGIRSSLGRISSYITVNGEDMVFCVRRCSHERTLVHSNRIELERVFPEVPYKCSIPTRWVVTGCYVCQKVELQEDGEYHVVDFGRNLVEG